MNLTQIEKKHIIFAILISIILRILLFVQIYPNTEILSAQDQKIYIGLSEYFLSHGDFGIGFGSERMPLYPLFLAFCKIFSDSLFFPVIVQHLLGLSAVLFAFCLGKIFSKNMAILSAYFAAINMNFIVESNLLLTESLFYPLFTLFFFYLIRFFQTRNNTDFLKAAIVLGACTLIRPVTMYLPVFIVGSFLFIPSLQVKQKIVLSFMFCFIFASVLSPWLYRNHVVYDSIGLTTQGASHMAGWVIPYVMQYEDNIDLATAKKKSMAVWNERMKSIPEEVKDNPFRLDRTARNFGLSYLMDASPASVIRAWFWGGMKNIFSPVTVELSFLLDMDRTLFGESKGKNVPEQLYNFIVNNKSTAYSVMMITGLLSILVFRSMQLIGVWQAFVDHKEVLFVFFVVGAYFLIVSGPVGYAKYRIPLESIFIVLSAFCFKKTANNKGLD